jgi:hypothetical protein
MHKVFCAILLITFPAGAQIGAKERLKGYRNKLYGKGTIASIIAGATLGEIRNSPYEYGRTWDGFGKRVGSRVAQNTVKQTIQLGVAAWHHEDLRYERSGQEAFFSRVTYAIKRTFIVPKSDGSGSTLALGRLSGDMGAGLIARSWQPPSINSVAHGFSSGGSSIAIDVGMNLVREFWPRRK